jgi:hypothetical protein
MREEAMSRPYTDEQIEAAFWARVNRRGPDECWLWTGSKGYASRDGEHYGIFARHNVNICAHRYSYILAHGSIPPELQIDHLCRTARCVNPSHLEAVTTRENTLRGYGPTALNARKRLCKRGHPLRTERRGRRCLVCQAEYQKSPAYVTKARVRHRRETARRQFARRALAAETGGEKS